MAQPIICQNWHTEMESGKKTHNRVMEWNTPVVPRTDADAESFADDLLAGLTDDEEIPEDVVADEDLMADGEEVAKVEDDA